MNPLCRFSKFAAWTLPVTLIIVLTMSFLSPEAVAQTVTNAPNSIYVEFGGNALLYSLNYDRLLSESISGRVGIMYYSEAGTSTSSAFSLTIIPVIVNYLIGSGRSKLELGAGIDILSLSALPIEQEPKLAGFVFIKSGFVWTAVVAYRYHPLDSGLNFRIGFTPSIGWAATGADINTLPWLGLSVGYSF
jgi:hypothetical protein